MTTPEEECPPGYCRREKHVGAQEPLIDEGERLQDWLDLLLDSDLIERLRAGISELDDKISAIESLKERIPPCPRCIYR